MESMQGQKEQWNTLGIPISTWRGIIGKLIFKQVTDIKSSQGGM